MPTPQRAPVPPAELAGYVTGQGAVDGVIERYLEDGAIVAAAVRRLAGPDWDWHAKRVLDFGCGSARVLRHFLDVAGTTELHGAELDPACVAWIDRNLSPPIEVVASQPDPPLPYADASFDLIWSTSVFSHLADTWATWLLELRRLVRPGGRVIASVMGTRFSEWIADEPFDERRIGMNVLGYGRPWHAGGPMVLHSEWWIRAHWGRAFAVETFEPAAVGMQDAVVLRRDDRPAPSVEELLTPEPDEPRELTAALHAVRQLHREHAALNGQHDAYAEAYRTEAERHRATAERARQLERRLEARSVRAFGRRLAQRVR